MPDADAIRHEFVKANGLRFHVAACGEGDRLARYLPGLSHWVQQEALETENAMMDAWLSDQPVPEA